MSRLSRLWDGGHWTSQSLKGLGPRKRLQDCNLIEVAAEFRLKNHQPLQFDETAKANKRIAREMVLELFGSDRFPHPIKVLSMPCVKWKFEGALLRLREDIERFGSAAVPAKTEIHAVENDRAVYYEAIMRVPGIRNSGNTIVDLGSSSYAERVLGYMFVKRYIFADVDDILRTDEAFDCVWLDYFGPMTIERMALIRRFFENNVRGALVVTNLKGRWNVKVSSRLRGFETYEDWIKSEFDGAILEHYFEYFDTSPMVQFAVSKAANAGLRSSEPAHRPAEAA